MSRESADTLSSFYEAINRGLLDEAMQYVHPDVEVRPAVGPDAEPGIRGREGVREFFADLAETWETLVVELKETYEAADGRVVAVENWCVRGRQDIEIVTELTDVYEFRCGLMVRAEGFRDKARALEEVGLSD